MESPSATYEPASAEAAKPNETADQYAKVSPAEPLPSGLAVEASADAQAALDYERRLQERLNREKEERQKQAAAAAPASPIYVLPSKRSTHGNLADLAADAPASPVKSKDPGLEELERKREAIEAKRRAHAQELAAADKPATEENREHAAAPSETESDDYERRLMERLARRKSQQSALSISPVAARSKAAGPPSASLEARGSPTTASPRTSSAGKYGAGAATTSVDALSEWQRKLQEIERRRTSNVAEAAVPASPTLARAPSTASISRAGASTADDAPDYDYERRLEERLARRKSGIALQERVVVPVPDAPWVKPQLRSVLSVSKLAAPTTPSGSDAAASPSVAAPVAEPKAAEPAKQQTESAEEYEARLKERLERRKTLSSSAATSPASPSAAKPPLQSWLGRSSTLKPTTKSKVEPAASATPPIDPLAEWRRRRQEKEKQRQAEAEAATASSTSTSAEAETAKPKLTVDVDNLLKPAADEQVATIATSDAALSAHDYEKRLQERLAANKAKLQGVGSGAGGSLVVLTGAASVAADSDYEARIQERLNRRKSTTTSAATSSDANTASTASASLPAPLAAAAVATSAADYEARVQERITRRKTLAGSSAAESAVAWAHLRSTTTEAKPNAATAPDAEAPPSPLADSRSAADYEARVQERITRRKTLAGGAASESAAAWAQLRSKPVEVKSSPAKPSHAETPSSPVTAATTDAEYEARRQERLERRKTAAASDASALLAAASAPAPVSWKDRAGSSRSLPITSLSSAAPSAGADEYQRRQQEMEAKRRDRESSSATGDHASAAATAVSPTSGGTSPGLSRVASLRSIYASGQTTGGSTANLSVDKQATTPESPTEVTSPSMSRPGYLRRMDSGRLTLEEKRRLERARQKAKLETINTEREEVNGTDNATAGSVPWDAKSSTSSGMPRSGSQDLMLRSGSAHSISGSSGGTTPTSTGAVMSSPAPSLGDIGRSMSSRLSLEEKRRMERARQKAKLEGLAEPAMTDLLATAARPRDYSERHAAPGMDGASVDVQEEWSRHSPAGLLAQAQTEAEASPAPASAEPTSAEPTSALVSADA